MIGFESLLTPRPAQPPRVRHMFHRVSAARPHLHQQQIEPIFVLPVTMPKKPTVGYPGDVPLLPGAYRLQSAPIIAGTAGFYFDKRHQPTLANDQIDVVMTQPESVRLDRPATRSEECNGEALAFHTEQMALIFPLNDWNEPAGCAHAPQYATSAGRRERSPALRGRKVRHGLMITRAYAQVRIPRQYIAVATGTSGPGDMAPEELSCKV